MFKHWKIASGVVGALWILFAWHFIALEVINLDSTVWVITGTINMIALIFFHAYFIYMYTKNKKKVMDLKEQYIETLKPDKPLRFCPSDDELMKRHLEQINAKITTKEDANKQTKEDTLEKNDEELENC